MDDKRPPARNRGALEGADPAALGVSDPPQPAPPGAQVDASEHLVPGAGFDDAPHTEAKPWNTSLAARSPQAGVANDPPDAQTPVFPAEEPEAGSEEADSD